MDLQMDNQRSRGIPQTNAVKLWFLFLETNQSNKRCIVTTASLTHSLTFQENLTSANTEKLVEVSQQLEQLSENSTTLSYADVEFTANVLSDIVKATRGTTKTKGAEKNVKYYLVFFTSGSFGFVYFGVKLILVIATGHTCCVHTCDFGLPRKHRKSTGLEDNILSFWCFRLGCQKLNY